MAARRAVVHVARLGTYHIASRGSGVLQPQPLINPIGYTLWQVLRGYSSLPPHTKLAMPALSPTMSQGNIARWYIKVGDEIAAGTVLADIETDKATLAFENQEDGYIAAILKPEGSKDVPVGETVAIVVEEEGDVAAFADYRGDSTASAAPAAAAKASEPTAAQTTAPTAGPKAADTGSLPEHIPLCMPALSPTMEQGNIVSWHVSEGDEVSPGTVLAEIETDKATLAFENQDEGYIAKILAPAGSKDVKVGQLVAVIVEDKEHIPAFANFSDGAAPAPAAAAAAAGSSQPAAQPEPSATAGGKPPGVKPNFRLGPAARKALQESGLSPEDVAPSGPNNIVTKWDVLQAVAAAVKPGTTPAVSEQPAAQAQAPAAPKPAAPKPAAAAAPKAAPPSSGQYTDVPNTQVRQIIAKRLLESKLTAPFLYVSADVKLNRLTDMRKSMAAQGTKVSVNDFVVRAVALALRDVPDANAFWDKQQEAAVQQPGVDVCVAVATEGGLITPIVKAADGKSLLQISAEVKDLAARARANKLKPEEFMGGSFSISNLGMYGLSEFSAIINPPQAAILAIGGAQKQVVVGEHEGLVNDSYMTVTLSADHRVYDGELASRFLDAFTGYMENPLKMVF